MRLATSNRVRPYFASLAITLALGLTAAGASAQTIDPSSDLGQFRGFRAAGMQAIDANDPATAVDNLNKAGTIMPDSPSILLLKTQVALQQRRKADAKAALKDYLTRGYVLDLAKNPDFNAVWDEELEDLLQGNESPVGDMHVTSTLPDFTLAEGITYMPDSDQLFVSGVRNGKIISLSAAGSRDVVAFRPGVAAYGLGLHDGAIWAVTAASRQTKGYDPKAKLTSKIVTVDPTTGAISNPISDPGKDRNFTHMLLGRDDVYVTDANSGEVLRVQGYGKTLQTLIPEGYMDSPGGMAENEDASVLMVADFISGLYRIDLTQGSMVRLLPPKNAGLLGISSLSRYGNDLIAIQNGFQPNRILRLHMAADWSSIDSVEVLLASPKLLAQPSQGLVADDHFIFVAKSQWANMDDQGNPLSDSPEPAVIGAIKLEP